MAPPDIIKATRKKLGLSAERFAQATGQADGRTVRRWEAGDAEPNGAVLILCRIWTDKRCPKWAIPSHRG